MNSQHECGLIDDGEGNNEHSERFDAIKFYSEGECSPLVLKANFVILNRDDGTGGFPVDSDLWSFWESKINASLANITDPKNCFPDEYARDSKIRLKMNVESINNTEAWDWMAKVNEDDYPSSSDPDRYICLYRTHWESLGQQIDQFESMHPGELNFFFVENGELISILEENLENETRPAEKYEDRFAAFDKKMASGCAQYNFEFDYYSTKLRNSYIITNKFSDFLIRNNFHDIWWPQHADKPAEEVWGWSKESAHRLYMHEMGHHILSEGHPTSCNQLMVTSSNRSNLITPDQLENVHKFLSTTNLHNSVDCNELDENVCDVFVENSTVVETPMSIYGDLVINEGMTLTVESEIFLSTNSTIVVRPSAQLIVKGGMLTSDCGDTWKGIKVYGGNSDFDVKFTNNAIIENTSEAAVSMFAPEPWPEIQSFGNGIVHAENSTFNNVRRIAELMSWTSLSNDSYFRGCTQNGGKHSITNWNCIGVEVTDNTFNDISHEAIVSSTGQFLIEENEIQSGIADILLTNATPGIGCDVFNNKFFGSNAGVKGLGTVLGEHEIIGNQFSTSFTDIFMDGENSYAISGNDITSPFGIVSVNNGNASNDVFVNTVSGNIAGLIPTGDNSDYNFYENCFTTNLVDVFIEGDISDFVAKSADEAANNCFTHRGIEGSTIDDINGSPDPFTYTEPDDEPIDCLDAVKAHENILIDDDNFVVNHPCGFSGSGNGTVPPSYNPCYGIKWGKDGTELKKAIKWIEDKITEIENDISLNQSQKDRYKVFYERCLKKVKRYLIESLVKQKKYGEVRTELSDETTEDAQILIFASYVYEGDLQAANAYLMSWAAPSIALADFRSTQLINLDRLPYGKFYQAPNSQLLEVESLARKDHPYAAYAKALYYELTGEIISSDLPTYLQGRISPRRAESSDITDYSIFPNPTSDMININISTKGSYIVIISDVTGVQIVKSKVDGRESIATDNWQKGLYFVTILRDDLIVHQEKIVVLN